MRHPKINSKALAATLAPFALAGGMLAPGAAAASPSPHSRSGGGTGRGQVRYSRGFLIHNYSSHPIKLTGITGGGHFEGRPNVGDVIQPGGSQDFEVQWQFAASEIDNADYAVLNQNGQQIGNFTAHMGVDAVDHPYSYCTVGGPFACTPPPDRNNGMWNDGATTLTFMDAPNTQITIPAGQGQAQADVLKQMCDVGGATCTFTPTGEEHIVGDERPAGDAVTNPYDNVEMSTTIHAADKVSETNSLGAQVTAGVEKIMKFEVTAKYEHEWTSEHEFSQDIEVKIPPHKKAWFTHKAPVIRDTGHFTVTLGNTTWHLNDVSFETPDTTNQAKQGEYILHLADATPQELAYAKAHPHPGRLIKP